MVTSDPAGCLDPDSGRFHHFTTVPAGITFDFERSYSGRIDFLHFQTDLIPANTLIVCDQNVQLPSTNVPTLWLDSTEANKTFSGVQTVIQFLQQHQANRQSTLIAIGGGCLLDLAGFVASIYMRGITWWAVPTTLLAMIDASVGGKTALNTGHVKNLVGSFYPARQTIIDPGFLDTLPVKHRAAGMAEIIKMIWIADKEGWERACLQDMRGLIPYAVNLKFRIINNDWFETAVGKGRVILNAGHTFGHAFEKLYPDLGHGQAVALGLVAEHEFAESYTGTSHCLNDLRQALAQAGLDIGFRKYLAEPEKLVNLMLIDKKSSRQMVQFIVARAPGDTYILNFHVDEIRRFVSKIRS
jgi:3-dehydroquinate synthase